MCLWALSLPYLMTQTKRHEHILYVLECVGEVDPNLAVMKTGRYTERVVTEQNFGTHVASIVLRTSGQGNLRHHIFVRDLRDVG